MQTTDLKQRNRRERELQDAIYFTFGFFRDDAALLALAVPQTKFDELQGRLGETIQPQIARTAELSAAQLAKELSIDINTAQINGMLGGWAQEYSNRLASELTETTRRAILESAIADRQTILDREFGQSRAESIASTETTRAIMQGTQTAAAISGYRFSTPVWHTEEDADVCDHCDPYDGQPLDEIGYVLPPLHPQCRCWISYELLPNEFNERVTPMTISDNELLFEVGLVEFAKRADVDAADRKRAEKKYGDVEYADETNKKYPIDTVEHIRAAWNYINKKKNAAKYADHGAAIKKKIVGAWKRKIDKSGPPSATKEMAKQAKDFVVFSAGHWNGEDYTDADLDNLAASYDPDQPPHVILGHSSDYKGKTLIPSFGRVLGGLKRVGHDLVAQGVEFNDKMADWIRNKTITNRSIEISKDNKKLFAIGMLGAFPPAVLMRDFDPALASAVNQEFASHAESKVLEFADAKSAPVEMDDNDAVNLTESLGKEETKKNVSEILGRFMDGMEDMIDNEADQNTIDNHVMGMHGELWNALNKHKNFMDHIGDIEENTEHEFAAKMSWLAELKSKVFKTQARKEQDVDAQKEKAYQDKIADLEAQVKEFADEKVKAEAKAVQAAQEAADNKIKSEIKEFCDSLAKEGKYTKADDEAGLPDEMFKAAKAGVDYRKMFGARTAVVELGEHPGVQADPKVDKQPANILERAEKYFHENKDKKEFTGLTEAQGISKVLQMAMTNRIKFN